MSRLNDYLDTLKAGLYELHARQAVRDEGSQILSLLRTTADQAADAAAEAEAVALVVAPAAAGGDLAAEVAALRADVARLVAVWLRPADVVDVTPAPAPAPALAAPTSTEG
jgi:hypothetical protein